MIPRRYDNLDEYVKPGEALVIYGPRQVGKTTLIKKYLETTEKKYRFDSGENIAIQAVLSSQNFEQISRYVGNNELIVIDEAQEISGIGSGLKIITDHHPHVSTIATGSSSFDLARNVGEPLVGRNTTVQLFPIAQMEMLTNTDAFDLTQHLEDYLLFGSYPEVINANTHAEKIDYLEDMVNSYLLKDILALDNIKSPQSLVQLLKLLALQLGNEVSLNELGTQLGWDNKTVSRYLDLLEKCFVIVRLGAFSRNLRNEVTSKSKYYFLDNGIRNAILQQFNPLDSRKDVGAIWENFLFIERLKWRSYSHTHSNSYFWRTYTQNEIDLVEEHDGQLHGYEFKWALGKSTKSKNAWMSSYDEASYKVVNQDNYLEFVTS